MNMTRIKNRTKLLYLLLGDLLMIMLAFDLAGFARYSSPDKAWALYSGPFVLMAFIYLMSFYIFTLYEHHERFKSAFFLSRFLTAVIFGFFVFAALSYFIPYLRMGRGMAFICMGYIPLLIALWRFIFEHLFMSKTNRKRVVIVGAGRVGLFIYKIMKHDYRFEVVGFLDDDQAKHHSSLEDVKIFGGAEHLREMAKNDLFDTVVVAIMDVKKEVLLSHLLNVKMFHKEVVDVPTIYEEVTGRIPMAHIRLGWIIFTSIKGMSRHLYTYFKRYFDIFLSLFGLLVNVPIMIIVAILIKIDSAGPVIFRQERVGINGTKFLMYKFRSMVVDAQKKEGGLYTLTTDVRVTRVGAIIRKLRIDEIPQLFNVFIGNMSFVGPRPEAVELSQKYEKEIQYYSLRHFVKPGLTGWAQIKFPYAASLEDVVQKFEYDMYYLKNMSFFLDIQIILKTISVVIVREFSR